MSAFLLARQINAAAGGTVISPWEVTALPDEWIEAATALMVDLPGMRQGQQQVEDRLAEWRKKHREQHG